MYFREKPWTVPGGGAVEASKKALYWFLATSRRCIGFKKKVHAAYRIINYISGRFRNRNIFMQGKGMLTHLLWVEVADEFRKVARRKGDVRALELSKAIDAIPPQIKDYVLTEYVRRVQLINGIYFYARRINNENADAVECKMQIVNLKRHLRKGLTRDRV